ncbi:condensation domain-containing protein [Catellatospora sp. KI3]|uniref:condensation domain-containing protein n=1 Tax=Catellatospora sp. KI3 TaxID=3041620 RepID=UPI00248328BC|nr:condensation domain-containing protein [Catellatospora sp. KI3]MDI1463583.1 condensation domain-containing protein [Catellatospora sp. KI3]
MDLTVAERIAVPFAGEGAGEGPLTWTQQSMWQQMVWADNSLSLVAVRDLAPGADTAEFVAEYGFYLDRYQAMRTLLRFTADGTPLQVVHSSGTAEIEVYDTGGHDPAAVAAELKQRFIFAKFDYEREWPIRMALVRRDGALTHAVLAIAHHAADGDAALAMFEDLRDRDPATGLPGRPPGLPPLAQARLQASPAGQRQHAASLRYWEQQLRLVPPTVFPAYAGTAPPRQGRYWYVEFTSPAMAPALRAAAARLDVSTQPVLFAAFAAALSQVTGVAPVAVMITVNNRFRPGFANAAGHLIQHGLCVLDPGDLPFEDLVRRARGRLLAAQKYGYYQQDEVDALVARIGAERGAELDVRCLYNDRRGPDEPAPAPTGEPGPAAESTLVWQHVDDLHHHLIFHANASAAALTVQVQVDTACLNRADVTALLERMEQLVLAAARPVDAARGQ